MALLILPLLETDCSFYLNKYYCVPITKLIALDDPVMIKLCTIDDSQGLCRGRIIILVQFLKSLKKFSKVEVEL